VRPEKWDRRFLELARQVSTWSKDPSTQVGAVVVDELNHVVGLGFNGFPRGVEDTDERLNDRPTKYGLVVHAEVNAILQAGHRARGGTIYVYPSFDVPPICQDCAKVAIQAGIVGIVGYRRDREDDRAGRWADSIAVSRLMWDEVGLTIRTYTQPEEGEQ
jgi:dCMP deaminase